MRSFCQSCDNIYGDYYSLHSFNFYCDQCYSKVTAEFTILMLIISNVFYTFILYYMRDYEWKNQEKQADLDSMVKLQGDEIKKLNVEIIGLKSKNDTLGRKRSFCCCSVEGEIRSCFSLAQSETYIMNKVMRKNSDNFSKESFKIDHESSSGGDVMEFKWAANKYEFETRKLAASLLTFIFKKTVKYIDDVKFHEVLIYCSKEYNRKINDIELKLTSSPGN